MLSRMKSNRLVSPNEKPQSNTDHRKYRSSRQRWHPAESFRCDRNKKGTDAARKLEDSISPGKNRQHHTQLNLGQPEISHHAFASNGHVRSQYVGHEACHEQKCKYHLSHISTLMIRVSWGCCIHRFKISIT